MCFSHFFGDFRAESVLSCFVVILQRGSGHVLFQKIDDMFSSFIMNIFEAKGNGSQNTGYVEHMEMAMTAVDVFRFSLANNCKH